MIHPEGLYTPAFFPEEQQACSKALHAEENQRKHEDQRWERMRVKMVINKAGDGSLWFKYVDNFQAQWGDRKTTVKNLVPILS